ncbi:MAG: hypothetical protein H6936_16455 [Burkholderiales bacterium]|nr:hypothetical protein [Nitrosomonas sp.]MCP5276405.1 hypothetical protein [Burkholderiales bacterium]
MQIEHLSMQSLEIPFKQSFRHASAVRKSTETVLVKAISKSGHVAYGEGCPRCYVTGETTESALQFFERISAHIYGIRCLNDLKRWISYHEAEINKNPAAWCAVELALLDLLAREVGESVDSLLGLPELSNSFRYSAVLGADDLAVYAKQLQRYVQMGFADFKVKVSGNLAQDQEKIALLKNMNTRASLTVRLDANNLWKDATQAIEYVSALNFPFQGIEEPLAVNDYTGCQKISAVLKIPIILDESFLNNAQFDDLTEYPGNWVINLRISKMGGILRALAIAQKAEEMNIPLVIGAQVGETSILSRAALSVVNACREQVVAQEGAFGTYLLKRDVTDHPIMFGKGGKLDASCYRGEAGFSIHYNFG